MLKRLFATAVCWLIALSHAETVPLARFSEDGMQLIQSRYEKQAFVVVLWSLECPSCNKELGMLSGLYKQKPFNLVLISTDGVEAMAEASAVLEKYSLPAGSRWIFSEYNSPRLRYAIDPEWLGELPRSYFYNSRHQRQAVSGLLSKQGMLDWLNQQQ